jgi:DNA transformation protein
MPDRNSKVRRRIAAGKLRLRIRDLRNLGPRSEQMLAAAGIFTAEELRRRGALDAYLAVHRGGAGGRSLNLLWALAGALEPWPEGRDWREVANSEARLPLLLAVEAREGVRRQALEAAGLASDGMPGPGAARGRQPSSGRRTASTPGSTREPAEDEAWVPGLPFKAPRRPAARKPGRSGRPRR